MDKRVAAAISYINDNIHIKLSVGEIANHVNLSSSRLCYLFKNETGKSLYQHIRLIKMQTAKELLDDSFLTTKQIMCKVGVTDESHFVRDFKRIFGLPPNHYRRGQGHINPNSGKGKVKIANK